MACLLIASNSYCESETIATRVAETLECRLFGWDELRSGASRYPATEKQLSRSLLEPPSLFGMKEAKRTCCLAYLTAVLTELLTDNDFVYHGPCAAFLTHRVPHVIRMLITGHVEQRATRLVAADGVTLAQARKQIAAEDRNRARTMELVFHTQIDDPAVFDLVIDVDAGGLDAAVQASVEAARSPRFQPSTYSTQCLADARLSAQVRAALVCQDPEIQVHAEDGAVTVRAHVTERTRDQIVNDIRAKVGTMSGVRTLDVAPMTEFLGRPGGL